MLVQIYHYVSDRVTHFQYVNFVNVYLYIVLKNPYIVTIYTFVLTVANRNMCVCLCVCVCVCGCVCVLAMYNKAQAQRISNREFKVMDVSSGD